MLFKGHAFYSAVFSVSDASGSYLSGLRGGHSHAYCTTRKTFNHKDRKKQLESSITHEFFKSEIQMGSLCCLSNAAQQE